MANAVYPLSIKTWVDRIDNVDDIKAGDINEAMAEIKALEMELDKEKAKTKKSQEDITAALENIANLKTLTGYGVINGFNASITGAYEITISSGDIVLESGKYISLNENTIIPDQADMNNYRIDIIYISDLGEYYYLPGIPGSSQPATPDGGFLLYVLSISVEMTVIDITNISDKRKYLYLSEWNVPTYLNSWADRFLYPVSYHKDITGKVNTRGGISSGINGTGAFIYLEGYKPTTNIEWSGRGGYVEISTDGTLTAYFNDGSTYIQLDGLNFETV